MLFQVKQTYDEDDIEVIRNTEKKKIRINKVSVWWFRLSALAGMLGLIFLSVLSLWKIVSTFFDRFLRVILVASLATWGLVILFFPACVLLFQLAFPKEAAKKSTKEKELVFSFEADHFTVNDGQDESKISYRSLDKFLEKDDHFLLYAPGGCFPIRKSCFIVGTPEEFGPFMREKYRTKDIDGDKPEKGLDET